MDRRSACRSALWPVLCGLCCGFFAYFPVTDSDLWWHLAAGREIWSRQAFLYTDPFSFPSANAPWMDVHWLFQAFAFAVVSLGGLKLFLVVKSLLFGAACSVLCWAAPAGRRSPGPAILVCLLAYQSRYLVLERPILFSLPAIALFVFLLERFSVSGRRRFLVALLPVQIAWVNSQGLFVLGFFIFLCYWLGEVLETVLHRRRGERPPTRTPAGIGLYPLGFAALVLSCFVNPYGIRVLAFPLKLFQRIEPSLRNIYSMNVSENVPLLRLVTAEPGYFWTVLGTAAAGLALFAVNRRRLRVDHLLLFCGFLALAFMAERNVLLFLFAAGPILCAAAAGAAQSRPIRHLTGGTRKLVEAGALGCGLGLVAIACFLHLQVLRVSPSHSEISPFRQPAGATDYLRKHWIPGNIFNADRAGGYLLWELYPPRQVFIDGRLIIRSREFFARYLEALDKPETFDELRARYGITHVLLHTAVFYRCMDLARRLYHDDRWRLVHADGSYALFVADSLAPTRRIRLESFEDVDAILDGLQSQWRDDPYIRREAQLYLAAFLGYLGAASSAEHVLRAGGR